MTTTVEDVLEHYGIKGMKWGVRRTRAQIDADSADTTAKKAVQERIKTNRGSTDPLSNQELQTFITRVQLEQQYSTLVAKEAQTRKANSRLERGRKKTDEILKYGKTANDLYKFANSPVGKKMSSNMNAAVKAGQAKKEK